MFGESHEGKREGSGGRTRRRAKDLARFAPSRDQITNPIAVAGVAVANLGSARTVYQATLHQDPAQGSLHRHHHQIGASARCLRTLSS